MKKLISILLVAMLIIGMFPATVFAADTTEALSIFANKGTVSGTSISWTQNGVTFTNNKGSSSTAIRTSDSDHYRVYAYSNVAITAPGNITKIVITATSPTYATAMENSAGTEATVSGSVVTITLDGSSDTYTIAKMTAQSRINKVAVTYAASEPGTPACEHANWELQGAADATCTTDGYEGDKFCLDCETVFLKGKVIPATNHPNKESNNDAIEKDCETEGFTDSYYCPDCDTTIDAVSTGFAPHSYVDGTCENCGVAQPNEVTATISFANTNQRTSYSTSAQVWQDDTQTVTFTNEKGGSTSSVGDYSNPARLYKDSTIIVSCAESYLIKSITFVAGGEAKYKTPWADTLTGETVSGDNYTVTFDTGVESFTCVASAQIRIASLSVTCEAVGGSTEPDAPACEHTETVAIGEAKAASCTETGMTAGEKCANPDCAKVLKEQEVIPALGHTYVDGECSVCHTPDPFVSLAGRYYIAAYRNAEEKNYYMTNDLGDKSTKRYQAEAVEGALPTTITAPESDKVFVVIRNEDGTFSIQAEGLESNNYLGWKQATDSAANNGALVAEENALKLTVSITENGQYNFHFAATDEERYLSLNSATNSNYFAWYKNTQQYNLTLIPVAEEEEKEPVVEMDGVQYGSFEEAYQQDPDTPIKLLAPLENVDVTGDLYLDLNGFVADVDNANAVYAYDSTATATTAGTGKLTTTAPVIIDNTVNGVRYIALKEKATRSTESTYTFHVLELNLTHVTLRASEEGLYYKAAIQCDEVLAAATEYHGLVVSIKNMPGADFASMEEQEDNNGWTKIAGAPEDGKLTSCSVFGIFKPGRSDNAARGEQKIYANAYIQLKDEEKTILVADTKNVDKQAGIGYSLRDVMEALNEKFPTLDLNDAKQAEQRKTILDFYKAWPTAMQNWNIDNIKNAAQ